MQKGIPLLIIGVILLGVSTKLKSNLITFAGLVLIGIGIALIYPAIIRKEEVIDNWSVLIENGQGKAEGVFKDTTHFIKESKAPNLEIEEKELSPGVIRGILGKKRNFLIITEEGNPRLEPFKIFLNARDYGNNLDVSWYLTYKVGFLKKFKPGVLADLDLFDQQDLRAYSTNAHHCLLKAVEKLMVEMHQDPSKIDRKSRGFLGIS
jgi:hypothetical protein